MSDNPKISIISPSKNTGRFVKDTIESILSQTYKEWEHIIVDGASTDETLDVIRQYPHIRLVSEKDSGPDEAFRKGLAMAKGEYVMMCCISDGYLDKNWLKRCVEVLDAQPEISLVWGIDQNMLEDGTLHQIVCNDWFRDPPPSGRDFIYYWLKHGTLFSERDLCIRKNVLKECFPGASSDEKANGCEQGHLMFAYHFNRFGYLSCLIPVVAAYGRQHAYAISQDQAASGETEKRGREYCRAIEELKKKLLAGEVEFYYRDGFGRVIPGKFDPKKYEMLEEENKMVKALVFLVPPIFLWLGKKIMARYRVHQNIREIRKSRQVGRKS